MHVQVTGGLSRPGPGGPAPREPTPERDSVMTRQPHRGYSPPSGPSCHIGGTPPNRRPPRESGPPLLRQLGHDHVVGRVDGVAQLLVRDRPVQAQGVPAGPADVGHDARVVGVLPDPLVGLVAVRAGLDADRGRPGEREDLVGHLDHVVALPRLVAPRAGLGQAVVEQLVEGHGRRPAPISVARRPSSSGSSTTARRSEAWIIRYAPVTIPTWCAGRPGLAKKYRSPGRASAGSTGSRAACWSWASRGTTRPSRRWTVCTRPEQSSPSGDVPPQRYGSPRCSRARSRSDRSVSPVGSSRPSGSSTT